MNDNERTWLNNLEWEQGMVKGLEQDDNKTVGRDEIGLNIGIKKNLKKNTRKGRNDV